MAIASAQKLVEKSISPGREPGGDSSEPLDIGILKDVLGFRFRRIQNHLSRQFSDHPMHGNLKSGLYSILALIAANPGVSQARLAHESGVDKTALVALLDDLEDKGWAVRKRAQSDRRRHSLFITEGGRATLDKLTIAAHEIEMPARQALTAAEFERLLATLDKLYTACFREEVL